MKEEVGLRNWYNQVPPLRPGHHMEKWQNIRKHDKQENQEVSLVRAGDHKATRNIKDSVTD